MNEKSCVYNRVTVDRETIDRLRFDAAGLIPALVQDSRTGRALILAYMNRESLEISIREGRTCFFSRSRNALWRKGETSGNTQMIVGITADCEFNSLLVEVVPSGPSCHFGDESCFRNPIYKSDARLNDGARTETKPGPSVDFSGPAADFSVQKLYELISARKKEMPEGSYTTYLFEKGIEKILKKVGEESAEVIIAAMKRNKDEIVYEAADLCYHMLVLLCEVGIEPSEIVAELAGRHK